jgi:hypothetical protein
MKRTDYPNGVIRLISDENMTLTDGQSYSKDVLIGLHGNVDSWVEITDEEAARRQTAQDDPELTDEEALAIIFGGDEV